MSERDRRIDFSRVKAGPSGTVVVAPIMVETTKLGTDGKPIVTDAKPGKALLVELRAKMGAPRRRTVQEVPWGVDAGSGRRGLPWFLDRDKKGFMSEVREYHEQPSARARGARMAEMKSMRKKGELSQRGELQPGKERRIRYMQVMDEHGERTGVTLLAEATRNPFQAIWWSTPLSSGRRVAVLSDGEASQAQGSLDRKYDISDTDQHLRGRGWLKGFTADSILKGIIEGDQNATHTLGYEPRKLTHTSDVEVPAISAQASLRKRRKDARKAADKAERLKRRAEKAREKDKK